MRRRSGKLKKGSCLLPELVRAQVPFSSCLEAYSPEQVDGGFWAQPLQAKSVAVK